MAATEQGHRVGKAAFAACAAALALGMMGCHGVAWAQQGQSVPSEAAPTGLGAPAGTLTQSVLAIQREGTQAGVERPLPGEIAALSYARYLKSFEYPIPERFDGQAATQTGASSKSGSGTGR